MQVPQLRQQALYAAHAIWLPAILEVGNASWPAGIARQRVHLNLWVRAVRMLVQSHAKTLCISFKPWRLQLSAHLEHSQCRPNLNRIPQSRASAVHLQSADVRCRYATYLQRCTHSSLLAGPIGCCQAAAAAVLVHCRAMDNGCGSRLQACIPNLNARLKQVHHASLATHISIRSAVEGLAPPINSQHASFGQHSSRLSPNGQIYASRQGAGAASRQEGRARQVSAHQGRRAGSVNAHTGTLKSGQAGRERKLGAAKHFWVGKWVYVEGAHCR